MTKREYKRAAKAACEANGLKIPMIHMTLLEAGGDQYGALYVVFSDKRTGKEYQCRRDRQDWTWSACECEQTTTPETPAENETKGDKTTMTKKEMNATVEALENAYTNSITAGASPLTTCKAFIDTVGAAAASQCMAAMVRRLHWDGRISKAARAWADGVQVDEAWSLFQVEAYSNRIHSSHLSQLAESMGEALEQVEAETEAPTEAEQDTKGGSYTAETYEDNAGRHHLAVLNTSGICVYYLVADRELVEQTAADLRADGDPVADQWEGGEPDPVAAYQWIRDTVEQRNGGAWETNAGKEQGLTPTGYESMNTSTLICFEKSLDYREPDAINEILRRADRERSGILRRYLTAVKNDDPASFDAIFSEAVEVLTADALPAMAPEAYWSHGIPIYRIGGCFYALNQWNGDEWGKCWKVKDAYTLSDDRKNYIVKPVYRFEAEEIDMEQIEENTEGWERAVEIVEMRVYQ